MNRDKVRGMMLGVTIGDQLGMPVETFKKDQIEMVFGRITDYNDPPPEHKWFGGMKSRWTDDAQLTLVVAESLIEKKCIDMDDMAFRHVRSMELEGDLGWGYSTRASVERLENGLHWSISGNTKGYGNGVAMKVAPVGIYYHTNFLGKPFSDGHIDSSKMLAAISDLARMTHDSRIGVESALSQVMAVHFCLFHKPETFKKDHFLCAVKLASMGQYNSMLTRKILGLDEDAETLTNRWIAMTHLKGIENIPIENKLAIFGGADYYVYNSLPFCYSMFMQNPTSIEALYDTVNAGGDTDTNGSIVGALLGALNGTKIFPRHLVDGLWQKERILDTAERLCDAFEIKIS